MRVGASCWRLRLSAFRAALQHEIRLSQPGDRVHAWHDRIVRLRGWEHLWRRPSLVPRAQKLQRRVPMECVRTTAGCLLLLAPLAGLEHAGDETLEVAALGVPDEDGVVDVVEGLVDQLHAAVGALRGFDQRL